MDTALRLSDKVLPPHLYLVSAKEDLVENACRAVADGLKVLAP